MPPRVGLLVAVSGGADSMCLLWSIISQAEHMGWRVEVAHVDHGLRVESAGDAEFVAQFCRARDVPFHVTRLEPPPAQENLEAWGRRHRYAFFEEVRVRRQLEWVVTAHHADDVAETYLMRLIANREPSGILGYDERRHLLRPLLSVRRAAIRSYVSNEGIDWREDPTNDDIHFLRNRVRKLLVPRLEEDFGVGVVSLISARAVAMTEDISVLRAIALDKVSDLAQDEFGSRKWLARLHEVMASSHSGLRWRIVEELLLPHIGYRLGHGAASRVVAMLEEGRVGIELGGGWRLRRRDGGIVLVSGGDST